MIDRQINGSQPDDGNPLNTSMNRDTTFDFRKGVEMAKDEVLHKITEFLGQIEDIMLDDGVEIENKFYFKAGFTKLAELLREDIGDE